MYYSTLHWKPIANGYSGFAPATYLELRRRVRERRRLPRGHVPHRPGQLRDEHDPEQRGQRLDQRLRLHHVRVFLAAVIERVDVVRDALLIRVHAELEPVIAAFREWRQAREDLSTAQEMLTSGRPRIFNGSDWGLADVAAGSPESRARPIASPRVASDAMS